jgi:ABC-type nitrate/sulfonate/bicarbonate transport system substrate-binding protein
MGYSGAGIGSDLLKVIDRAGLWRKHGVDVKSIYLSSGSLMAQTLSSGDIGIAGFDTPAMLNLALAGHSLKIVAVPINRIEPMFVVRSNIRSPSDLRGKKITISRFGSGSDIITRVALRYWKLDPDKDVSFFQSGNTPTRVAALIAGYMDAALVSSTGVAKIVATGCCRVLADLTELPLEFANMSWCPARCSKASEIRSNDSCRLSSKGFMRSKPDRRSRARCCARATAMLK